MLPTQSEFEALLSRLREEQTESSLVDGKTDIALETAGDRAYLIRHIAALANNIESSNLIIGVLDRTWDLKGLPAQSPLMNADETQQRINNVLARRLDPTLSIRYRTYEVSGVTIGLIAVDGTRAPYIVAIEDRQYGGARSHGASSHITRGVIYIRRGANSVVANRQSEVLNIVEKVRQAGSDASQADDFLANHNYLNVEADDFGHHRWSNELQELHLSSAQADRSFCPAESWASFVFLPVGQICGLNTVELEQLLAPGQRIGRGQEWYQQIPTPLGDAFVSPRATPREYVGTWNLRRADPDQTLLFIRIHQAGHIEIASTCNLFFERDGVRCFDFVNLVG